MEVKWNSMEDNLPDFNERVLVFDPASFENDEPHLKCATYVERIENFSGTHHTWQVEQDSNELKHYEWWCKLPTDLPTF